MTRIIDQNQSLFDDQNLPSLLGSSSNDFALISSASRPVSRGIRKVQAESSKHKAAVQGISEKTALVIAERVRLQNHGARNFSSALSNSETLNAAYNGAYKDMFEDFLFSSLKTTGKNILGFELLAAGLMSDQMQRDPDPPDKSLRERLFG